MKLFLVSGQGNVLPLLMNVIVRAVPVGHLRPVCFRAIFLLFSHLARIVCWAEDATFLLLQVKQEFEERLEKILRVKNRLVSGSRTHKSKA